MKPNILIFIIVSSIFSLSIPSVSAKNERYTYCVQETLGVLDAGKEFVESLDIVNFAYDSLSSVASCVDSSLKDMENKDKQYQEKIDTITAMYLDMNQYLQHQEVIAAKLYQYKLIPSNVIVNSMTKNRRQFLSARADMDLSFTKIGGNDFSLKNVFTKNARKVALQTIKKAANDKSNLSGFNGKQRNPTLGELKELEGYLKKTNGNIYGITEKGISQLNSSTDLLQRVQKKMNELSKK